MRRFLINLIFFLVLPFIFWCKCFTPSEDDLLVASNEWQCAIRQEELFDGDDDDCDSDEDNTRNRGGQDFYFYDDDDDDDEIILTKVRNINNCKMKILNILIYRLCKKLLKILFVIHTMMINKKEIQII